MNLLLKLIKDYVSTGSFLMLSLLVYLFSDKNEYAQMIILQVLPQNGKPLAFITFVGLIFIYEVSLRHQRASDGNKAEIKEHIICLQNVVERGLLISDVNSAFSEFKASERKHITGEYYIKEILSLKDTQEKLGVNSYTQNKLEYLITKIKYD